MKENYAIEKEKLVKLMSGDKSLSEKVSEKLLPMKEVEMDSFDQVSMLIREIDERRQFLNDMIELGKGEAYRQQIETEIAMRISQLKKLQK